MSEFTHINEQGNAKMVDVSEKNITKRTAIAHSSITVNPEIYQQIVDHTNKKGNVLNTAQIAGIMAAKNTADIIPMCHPLPLTGIDVEFQWQKNEQSFTLNIRATVSTTGKTGVEMEALTAATAVALTVYDMTKALDKGMVIGETYLLSKSGGNSGDFERTE
ncbi:cyclic pyranopterin monophosphate synthase MoaC [Staphylococcus equorum]|uniref:Cyclic pyranopterin monophosphate synthase n=1 Tax=Staphylococcus equorum TaxID=246432 RepID=A0A9X4L9U0_9STAP|nr:cyclic pyranopterin monophosphate synthase MoaC [Staphylococcus equorum]MDG0843600.1 cyclic pyranopterin monophosphate synthase MoaC [Staphylococcus equorum]MDG0859846.1 cyclic pyranopterin monophosphate synthase MoaC [Staphylococcus equorum]